MLEKAKTPAIRFKYFNDDWEQRKLADVAYKVTEKNSKCESAETFTNSAELGIISQRDYFDHDISNSDNIDSYYIVRNDDFIYNPRISTFAPVGPVNRNKLGRNGVMSPLYTVFRTKSIDSRYLEYFFKSNYWHKFMYLNGDTGARADRFSIKDSVFFEMPVPTPHINEQTKIGKILEETDNLITLHQRKLLKLKNVKKAMLEKMFPKNGNNVPEIRFEGFADAWEQRKLGETSNTYSGGTPSVGNERYYGGDIPFIRSGEINSDSTELFLTEEALQNSSAKLVKEGDILYALYGATSGEVGISRINGAINQAILAIQPSDKYNTYFISQWLRKEKSNIVSTYLQGGQGNLSGNIVKELSIKVPQSKYEQDRMGSFFKQMDNLITLHQRKLEKLQNIKKSMLGKMFV